MAAHRTNPPEPAVAASRGGSVREPWRRWLGLAVDLVYPPSCASCSDELVPGSPLALCATCRAALVDARPACPRCGASLPPGPDPTCPMCDGRRLRFHAVARLGTYEGALRSAVLRTKRASGRGLAMALGDLLAERAGLEQFDADVVVPVPMHWMRRAWRGANSAEVIARRLAGRLGLPMRSGLLARRRRTAPQASLPPSRRRANVRGAFRARPHADLPGARVLLVDDIMTSGATANEAARMLAGAGAEFVAVAVLARAEGLA